LTRQLLAIIKVEMANIDHPEECDDFVAEEFTFSGMSACESEDPDGNVYLVGWSPVGPQPLVLTRDAFEALL